MQLIDSVVRHDDASAEVVARIGPDHIFADATGAVPAWAGLEMMAQAVAAWAGSRAREQGETGARAGYLLACRSYDCDGDAFPAGAALRIHIRVVLRQDNGFGSFTGEIHRDGERVARGKLSVLETGAPGAPETGESE